MKNYLKESLFLLSATLIMLGPASTQASQPETSEGDSHAADSRFTPILTRKIELLGFACALRHGEWDHSKISSAALFGSLVPIGLDHISDLYDNQVRVTQRRILIKVKIGPDPDLLSQLRSSPSVKSLGSVDKDFEFFELRGSICDVLPLTLSEALDFASWSNGR